MMRFVRGQEVHHFAKFLLACRTLLFPRDNDDATHECIMWSAHNYFYLVMFIFIISKPAVVNTLHGIMVGAWLVVRYSFYVVFNIYDKEICLMERGEGGQQLSLSSVARHRIYTSTCPAGASQRVIVMMMQLYLLICMKYD